MNTRLSMAMVRTFGKWGLRLSDAQWRSVVFAKLPIFDPASDIRHCPGGYKNVRFFAFFSRCLDVRKCEFLVLN
jgi:hypothetical protein